MPQKELPELTVADAAAWGAWLGEHHAGPDGVWLVLAKKGTVEPTSLNYDQALDEAICFGWIDGQLRRKDERTYLQRFTPRRPRSSWSQANVARVARLEDEGRMQAGGRVQVEAAQADGRFASAYPGRAGTTVPDDLAAASAANPAAKAAFEALNRDSWFGVLYRIRDAKRHETRARRIAGFVELLARGEAPFPDPPAGG